MNYNYIIKNLFFLEPKCYWNQLTKFEIDRTILACLLCTNQPLLIDKHSLQKVMLYLNEKKCLFLCWKLDKVYKKSAMLRHKNGGDNHKRGRKPLEKR